MIHRFESGRSGRSRRSRRAAFAAVVAGGVLLLAGSSSAIVDGRSDGEGHPNVAAIVYDGSFVGCSGFLIAPRVIATAAHCIGVYEFLGFHATGVSFASTVDEGDAIPLAAEPIVDPRWPGIKRFNPRLEGLGLTGKNDIHDVAVLLLAEDAPATAVPVELPSEGLLDRLAARGGLNGRSFTAVGYGTTDPAVFPRFPSDRRVAETVFQALDPARLLLGVREGGACVGDSGSPALLEVDGRDVAVAITSLQPADPNCRNVSSYYRIDTRAAREFLRPYVDLP